MNLPLFISSANFLLMKSLLLVLFQGFVFFTQIDSATKNQLIKRYLFYLLLPRIYGFSPYS